MSQGPVDIAYPMSGVHATMKAAKNEATPAADRANGRQWAGVSPPTSSEERKRLMLSIPPTPDTTSTCVSPHVDGCPACVVNVEPPQILDRSLTGCRAAYECTDCRHRWTTSWGCS